MRRLKIIGAAVCAVLLAAAAVILIRFPGLITCLRMKWKYDNLDRTTELYAKQSVPADFREWKLNGITLSAPADYTAKENRDRILIGADGKTRIFVSGGVTASALDAGYDPFAVYSFTEFDLRQYFQTVGKPYRDPASNALLFYCKDELSVWDGLRLRGSDRKVFAELCEIKDGGWETEETEKMTVPGGTAYISGGLLSGGALTVTMFPDSGGEHRLVMVREQDAQKARQIISSMAFAD